MKNAEYRTMKKTMHTEYRIFNNEVSSPSSVRYSLFRVRYSSLGLGILLLVSNLALSQVKNDYPIQPVAFTQVQVMDNFWAPKIRVNAEVTIPYTLNQCKKTGRIDNFLRAAGKLPPEDRKSTRLNSSHSSISYAVFCLKKKIN